MADDTLCATSELVLKGNNDTARRIDSNVAFTIAYFTIGVVIDISCLLAFWLFKRRFERTSLRPTILLVMSVLGSLVQMSYGSMQTITRGDYPCWCTVVMPIMIVPFLGGSIIGRLLLLLYLSRFSEASLKMMAASGSLSLKEYDRYPTDNLFAFYKTAFNLLFVKPKDDEPTAQVKRDLVHLRFLVSRRGILLTTLFFIIPFLLVALIMMGTNPVFIRCRNCAISMTMIICIIIIAIVVILTGFIVWCRVRKLPDVWGLSMESFFSILFCLVAFLGFILTTFAQVDVFETYSHQFLMSLGLWLVVIEQSVVQLYLGYKAQRREMKTAAARITRNTSDLITVDSIMIDHLRCKEFERHLAEEFGLESLLFLKDALAWKDSFHDISEAARRERAKILVQTYIKSDGLYAINVPYSVTDPIFKKMKHSGEDPLEDTLFDAAIEDVRKLLNSGAVLRFTEKSKLELVERPSPQKTSDTSMTRTSNLSSARNSNMSSSYLFQPSLKKPSSTTSDLLVEI